MGNLQMENTKVYDKETEFLSPIDITILGSVYIYLIISMITLNRLANIDI